MGLRAEADPRVDITRGGPALAADLLQDAVVGVGVLCLAQSFLCGGELRRQQALGLPGENERGHGAGHAPVPSFHGTFTGFRCAVKARAGTGAARSSALSQSISS